MTEVLGGIDNIYLKRKRSNTLVTMADVSAEGLWPENYYFSI